MKSKFQLSEHVIKRENYSSHFFHDDSKSYGCKRGLFYAHLSTFYTEKKSDKFCPNSQQKNEIQIRFEMISIKPISNEKNNEPEFTELIRVRQVK